MVSLGAVTLPALAVAAPVPTGGRAWELVTPSAPVNAVVADMLGISDSGDRILYSSRGPMPGAAGGDALAHNLALRTASGWRTEPISGSYSVAEFSFSTLFGPLLKASDRDLTSFVLLSPTPLLPSGPPEPQIGIYRWFEGGRLALLADLGSQGEVLGASFDLSEVFFGTTEHLLPGDADRSQGDSVYEVAGETLRQVDINSDGSLLSTCGSTVPPGGVSESGRRVYLISPENSGCGLPARIFLREGGTNTVEVSASHCAGLACEQPRKASFAGATPSGAIAFFTTAQPLTAEDENSKRDLYRFDAGDDSIELVSPGSAGVEGEVLGATVLTSTDGSRTYFYANGRLLPGQGSETGPNLYLAAPDGIHFVAPVGPSDPLQISEGGKVAVLSTAASLAARDHDEAVDTYLYDADSGDLSLISTGPTGGDGNLGATIASPLEALIDQPLHRALSVDGRKVFFSTAEALVPEDQNEATDVYEWESGQLGLISSGQGSDDAKFAGASADGETVAFVTAASLLPSDRDGGDLDIYVAHPGGGLEEAPEDEALPCERCSSGRGRPARPVPASIEISGRKTGRIRLRRIPPGAGAQVARGARFTILLAVPAPGRVSVVASGRIGKRSRTMLRGVAGAVAPGGLLVRVRATNAAARALRRKGRLRMHLFVRQGTAKLSRPLALKLGASR